MSTQALSPSVTVLVCIIGAAAACVIGAAFNKLYSGRGATTGTSNSADTGAVGADGERTFNERSVEQDIYMADVRGRYLDGMYREVQEEQMMGRVGGAGRVRGGGGGEGPRGGGRGERVERGEGGSGYGYSNANLSPIGSGGGAVMRRESSQGAAT